LPVEKSIRNSLKKSQRNVSWRSSAKTHITKAKSLIEENDNELTLKAIREAESALDKAAQKGAIHRNNAARRKSRLMKRLNSASSA